MKHLKVNYLSTWDDEGYHYRQTVYVSREAAEAAKIKLTGERVQYLKLTQARQLKATLKELNYNVRRFLLDRNTRIVVA